MNELFDIVSCEENRESQNRLFKLIESGEGVLFVGSGSSVRLNYPSWEGVLNELANQINDDKVNSLIKDKIVLGELLLAAEIIKNRIDLEVYNSAFKDFFKKKEPSHDDFHKLLVNVKFKGFVTTNYDPVIECALMETQKPSADYGIVVSEEFKSDVHYFLNSLVHNNDFSSRYHLYLHGKYNIPSSTILTYGDYVEKYNGRDIREQKELYEKLIGGSLSITDYELQSKLKAQSFRTLHYKVIYMLFASQRLVFTGFGLRDDFLNKIIDEIEEDFDPLETNHFALMSNNDTVNWTRKDYLTKKKVWKSKGFELVFFDDNKDYGGVVKFFEGLSQKSFITNSLQPDHPVLEVNRSDVEPEILDNKLEDDSVNSKLLAKTIKIAEELKSK